MKKLAMTRVKNEKILDKLRFSKHYDFALFSIHR